MILAAITVTILFELPIERVLASETLLLISKPGHVGNVFIIEFIARHLPRSRQARSSINRSSAYQAERTEITKSKGHCRKPPDNGPSLSSPRLESTTTVSLQPQHPNTISNAPYSPSSSLGNTLRQSLTPIAIRTLAPASVLSESLSSIASSSI